MKYCCDKFKKAVEGDIDEEGHIAKMDEDKNKWVICYGYAELFTIEYCLFCGKKLTGEQNDRRE